jgi:hypothetical protein
MSECETVRILYTDFAALEVAAVGGARDGLASKADVRAAEAGKNGASPLLQKAANRVISSVGFDTLDVFGQRRSAADGLISREDLRGYFNRYCR